MSTSGGGTWYEKGMAWAKENGISDGSAPNGSITREQLAVMLYRASGADAGSAELSAFADSKAVSSWAAEDVYKRQPPAPSVSLTRRGCCA